MANIKQMVFENTKLGTVIEKLVEIAPQLDWSRVLINQEKLLSTISPSDLRLLEKSVGSNLISFLLENKDKLSQMDLIDAAFHLERLVLPIGDRIRIEANIPGGEHFYVPNATRGGCEFTRNARRRLLSPYFYYDIGERRILELNLRSNKEFCSRTNAFAYSVLEDHGWESYRFFYDNEEDEIIARVSFPI